VNDVAKGVALLGWGSLIWESRPEFDALHCPWAFDGPVLKLEFSRISSSRNGALTLVLDNHHGVPTTVAHCLSLRSELAQVVQDLRAREGTTTANVGYLRRAGETRCRDAETEATIAAWLVQRDLDAAVWTDLASNFAQKKGKQFSVAAALAHLATLDQPTRSKALAYIRSAPSFVQTPLRAAVGT
jgi:hypothetical protein